ncbi:hypothetical protein DRP04_00825 [Archaeoglobales archaeon]|nr:MAG: hypothetical protein DRP04_00825 [Archaeoglobales archaeon]
MKEFTLPDGRVIKVGEFDADSIIVEFEEHVPHKLVFPKKLKPREVAEEVKKYLYGYDDPETGEHVDGYFDRIKKKKEREKEWWK